METFNLDLIALIQRVPTATVMYSGKSGYNKKIKQLMKDAGLHRQSSGAVNRYTMMEIKDRFDLMNIAFEQEDYRVDKNLKVISSNIL